MVNISGQVSINTAPAVRSLQAAARAMENVEKAGKDVTIQQRAAMSAMTKGATALAAENRRAAESFAKIGAAAIKADRDMRNADLNASNKRKNDRAKTAADVGLIGARTDEVNARIITSGDESAAKIVLANARAATEEVRQRIALENSASAIASRSLRDQIALRAEQNRLVRQATKDQEAAARLAQRDIDSANSFKVGQLHEARYVLGDLARGITVTSLALAALPVATAKIAIDWEKDFANVVRTVGVTGESVDRLKGQFVSLVTTMPVSFSELAEIGTLAGQLGIAEQSIGQFTKTVAMFSSATGVSIDESATAFGRLNSLVPDVQGNFTELGDAILKVGVNSVATEQSIIRVTTQIAAVASSAGFSSKEIIGLSGALASVGVPPELSRGVTTRVFGDIGKAVATGGLELEKWGATVNMTGAQFKQAWSEDASGTFLKFMGSIRESGAGAALVLNDLGITSVRDVPILMRLANAADSTGKAGNLLAESIDYANNSAGEMERQFGVTSGTVAAKLQVFVQNIMALADAIGSSQLGMFGDFLDDWTSGLQELSSTLDENVKLFGMWELDMTNADLLAFAGMLAAGVAAAGLLLAGLVRLAQGFVTLKVAIGTMPAVLGAFGVNTGTAAAGMDKGTKSAGRFGTAMSGLARNLPVVGLAITAAVTAFEVAANALDAAGSSADDAAGAITNYGNSAREALNQKLKGDFLSADGFDMFESNKALRESLDLMSKFDTGEFGAGAMAANWGQRFDSARTYDGLRKLGEGYKQLISEGNGDKAIAQLNSLAKEANLSEKQLTSLIKNADLTSYFKGLLRENGIEITTENLAALARDGLAGVGVEAEGAASGLDVMTEEMSELELATQASIDGLAAMTGGMFDFGSAIEAATEDGVLSMDKFMETIRKQAQDQQALQSNLGKLSAMGMSSGFMDYLTSLGPAAADVVAGFVANPEYFTEAQTAWEQSGQESADRWASAFKKKKDLAAAVGAEFGQETGNALFARLDAMSGDELVNTMNHYQAVLDLRKLFPQASLEQLDATMSVEVPAGIDKAQLIMDYKKLYPQATTEDITTLMNNDLPLIIGAQQFYLDYTKLHPKATTADVKAEMESQIPTIRANGQAYLNANKLRPQLDAGDAESQLNSFIARAQAKNITLRASMIVQQTFDTNFSTNGGLSAGGGGVLEPPKKAAGGAIYGPGTGTSDSIPAMLSNGEHVLTAKEVAAAGGHDAIYALRRNLLRGRFGLAAGGPAMGAQQTSGMRIANSSAYATLDPGLSKALRALGNRPIVLQIDGRTVAQATSNGARGLSRSGTRR